jgi:serine/threonine protein kinase
MITSLLQGGELESIIPDDGLAESAAKFYAAGILEGLAYMHRRHIIHRDVKPENVLINEKGYPVLIDLGFGKNKKCVYQICGTVRLHRYLHALLLLYHSQVRS